MQINLTYHKIGDLDCPSAFKGKSKNAIVINQPLYEACKEAAKDPVKNLEAGRQIYDRSGGNFLRWGGFTSGGYLKYL